ncbi:hypothetical protein A0H81_13370 [Grifola frondosa]|uniref:Uncharacterized protein n=1 Tax=Grifola frondosa TaxID=5627 RepID=A0A1C7LPK6_GRIFR|nr:hypothetical protein A0H81_13370 [Grifola frondosa]
MSPSIHGTWFTRYPPLCYQSPLPRVHSSYCTVTQSEGADISLLLLFAPSRGRHLRTTSFAIFFCVGARGIIYQSQRKFFPSPTPRSSCTDTPLFSCLTFTILNILEISPPRMYLLHTQTLTLKEFPDSHRADPYAILSHVWHEDELLFRHIRSFEPGMKDLRGYSKVAGCCSKALSEGYEWVWIDSCCIDKSSSSELESEAINSMYEWYRQAEVCYMYLDDVPAKSDMDDIFMRSDDFEQLRWRDATRFRKSRWFSRGWTLQELIAPKELEFLAHDWSEIGTRLELLSAIKTATGVDRNVLLDRLPLTKVSVADRMRWAGDRSTTRVEDRTYSLVGLFGIHMPTLYGEGKQAFIRLQHEILRRSTDHSILAWRVNNRPGWDSCLAYDPVCFGIRIASSIQQIPYADYARMFGIIDPLPIIP